MSKNVLNNECDPHKMLSLFQSVLFSNILWGMEFHEKHYRSKSVKDWAIYHIFPVVSLTPRPHFGILPDVEICTFAPTPKKKIK